MPAWRKNAHGLKDAGDTYRTFGGHQHSAWLVCPSVERIAEYRAAGIRCRRVKDVLYVHVLDEDAAAEIDSKADARPIGPLGDELKEAALQAAADANGGYIGSKTVRIVKAAIARIEAA